jgi:hypothetical protein
MTNRDVMLRLSDQPFKPFRLKMVNNAIYDITAPWMLMPGETSAVVATQTRKDERGLEVITEWKTISISHILEFGDLDVKRNGSRKK